MKKIKKFSLSSLTLRSKLLLAFVFSMILSFCIAGYGSYYYVSQSTSEDVKNLAEISVSQINKNIDTYIDELYRLTSMALSDEELHTAIKNAESANNASEKLSSTQKIFQFLYNIYLYRTDLYSVCLQTPSGELYSRGFSQFLGDSSTFSQEPWYLQIKNDPSINFLIVGHRISKQNVGLSNQKEVFTVARRVIDTNGRFLGILILDTKFETFQNILKELEREQNAQVFLQDQNQKILYTSNTKFLEEFSSLQNIDHNLYSVISNLSNETHWTVTMVIPRAQLFTNANDMFKSVLTLIIICLGCSILLYGIISYAITQPIKALIRSMRQVEKGDFSVCIHSSAHDEIGELSDGFNHMTKQIDHLLNKMVEFEIRDKESEYMILQSQINPHFLYNTLEVIRMKCIIHKEPEIAEAINTLSNLFRLSISRREHFVPLKEEIEHVKSYISIQNFRFDNKYHLSVHVDELLLEFKVFKLMLQPLVENSVFHGLELKPGDGHIDISVQLNEAELCIEISDDGVGINPERLGELRSFLENPKGHKDNQSIGLRNVHERIQLFFGKKYGLQIWSHEHMGTKIIITMPAFLDENEVDFHV